MDSRTDGRSGREGPVAKLDVPGWMKGGKEQRADVMMERQGKGQTDEVMDKYKEELLHEE